MLFQLRNYSSVLHLIILNKQIMHINYTKSVSLFTHKQISISCYKKVCIKNNG